MREVGARLERHPSTVSRELKRNRSRSGVYYAETAHRRARNRAGASRCHPQISAETWGKVETRLREDHSPEQIAASLGRERQGVSHTRIYQYIAIDRRAGGTLWLHRRHPRRYWHHPVGPRRFTPSRTIRERPAHVNNRRQVGHWEIDTLRPGQGNSALLCAVERRSRFVRLAWLKTGLAKPLAIRLVDRLREFLPWVKSLTADRGSEFSWHWFVEDGLQAPMYFCDPYCAWQRGTVENTNGLLRQYFPRRRDFSTITTKEIQAVEDRLNTRPRKVLGYRTPREVFYASLNRCAS